jgi:hypothetical protein
MVWYTKTELRKCFLALVEEKEPLLRVCRPGESSTLGKYLPPKWYHIL